MRVFVALVLPEPFRRKLIEATAALCAARSELRWIGAAKLHLTLAFLGELDERGADIVEEAARNAASVSQPFSLRATGLLALPRRSGCRVLASAIGEGAREATALVDRFEHELALIGREAGYPFRPAEKRPFSAHITLARYGRTPASFTAEELDQDLAVSAKITSLAVYESILGAGEAHYRELARMELASVKHGGKLR